MSFSYLKGLLARKDPKIDRVIDEFVQWSQSPQYLIFRKENIHTRQKEYKAVKASKRGNDVYSWKLGKRLKRLYNLPDVEFFNYKDRNKTQKTRAVFVTLTYARNETLATLWEQVGKDFNRWASAMRKRYGGIKIIRCWEAQRDGYPHIHCVLLFEEAEFKTFFYNKKWRLSEKRELETLWRWGFCDFFALYSLGAGVGYVLKYVTKVNNALLCEKPNRGLVLSLALMWVFRKRAFSVSRDFSVYLVEFKSDLPVGQVDLEGKTIYKWYLVGFWIDLNGELSDWSTDLSYNGFWRIRSSKEFIFNKALLSG